MVTKSNKSSPYLAWAVALLPLLSVYGFASIGLDFGTLVLLICLAFNLFSGAKVNTRESNGALWMIYIVYLAVSIFFTNFTGLYVSYVSIISRSSKMILYVSLLIYISTNSLVDLKVLKHKYLKIAKICTIFLIIQTIAFYLLNIDIPGYIDNGLLISESYGSRLTGRHLMYRPTSLFYEPSHYSEYCIIALVLYLFDKDNLSNINALLLSSGILLSTSGMGIICVSVLWVFKFISQIIDNMKKKGKIQIGTICAFIFVIIFGIIFVNSSIGTQAMGRIFDYNNSNSTTSVRTEGFDYFVNQSDSFVKLLGNGYGNVLNGVFYTSWSHNLWCLGYIGSLLILVIYFKSLITSPKMYLKLIVILNCVLSVFTTLFMGKNFFLYFIFIEMGRLNEKESE